MIVLFVLLLSGLMQRGTTRHPDIISKKMLSDANWHDGARPGAADRRVSYCQIEYLRMMSGDPSQHQCEIYSVDDAPAFL